MRLSSVSLSKYSLPGLIHPVFEGVDKVHGRGYSYADSETMFSLGIANITASVLVLALYINSKEVIGLYRTPEILWFLCLLLLYWGNRIWVGARRDFDFRLR